MRPAMLIWGEGLAMMLGFGAGGILLRNFPLYMMGIVAGASIMLIGKRVSEHEHQYDQVALGMREKQE